MLQKKTKKKRNPYALANYGLLFVAMIVYIYGSKVLPYMNSQKDGYYTPILTIDGRESRSPIGILAVEGGVQYLGAYEATKLLENVRTAELGGGTQYAVLQGNDVTHIFTMEKASMTTIVKGVETETKLPQPPLFIEGMWYLPVPIFETVFGYDVSISSTNEALEMQWSKK